MSSRYNQKRLLTHRLDGREVTYLPLRLLPTPDPAYTHQVEQGERLDQIAHQYLNDATQFWRICDANQTMLPGDLTTETGRPLKIPYPQR